MKSSRMQRIPELDGLRGIAILMVLIWHYITCQIVDPEIGSAAAYAKKYGSLLYTGVDLFFCLSGFLIVGIICDKSKGPSFWRTFWIRRTCRILPVYFLLLFSYLLLTTVTGPTQFDWLKRGLDDALPTWSYFTFCQNIVMGYENSWGGHCVAVTWSLCVEEQFYLCAPLAFWILGYRRFVCLLLPMAILALFLRIFAPGFHAFVNLPFRMDCLCMGAFAAVTVRWATAKNCQMQLLHLLVPVCLTLSAGTLIHLKWAWLGVMLGTWLALNYTAIIAICFLGSGIPALKFLRPRYLTFLGEISYPLYMFHQMFLGLAFGAFYEGEPTLAVGPYYTLAATIASLVFATVSTRHFESHFNSFGARFHYDQPGLKP